MYRIKYREVTYLKYVFYPIFALEMAAAFSIADKLADKIKHKYKHSKFHNILGIVGAVVFFVISATTSHDAWSNMNWGDFLIGFIFLCISFFSLTFIQRDYTSPKR